MMSTVSVPGFVDEVRKYGIFDANACLNCGSCTVVCSLSGNPSSFPRKPIQFALLGLKEPLLASLEPWLCYDCGDCSTACPRKAEPRESLMTLRRFLAAAYDKTRVTSSLATSTFKEVLALILSITLVFGLVALYHLYYVDLGVGDFLTTTMGMEHMFDTIIYYTYAIFIIPVVILALKSRRMHRLAIHSEDLRIPRRYYLLEAKTFFGQLFSQKNMRRCEESEDKRRWPAHWSMSIAFAAKSAIVLFLLKWFQTDNIYPLYNPQRWIGYIIAAILIFVPGRIIVDRIRGRRGMHRYSQFADYVLPTMLLLTALSGILVHIFRYLEFELLCNYTYAFHVAIVTSLLVVELPFGKLSHVVFRPLALYFEAVKSRAAAEYSRMKLVGQTADTVNEGAHQT